MKKSNYKYRTGAQQGLASFGKITFSFEYCDSTKDYCLSAWGKDRIFATLNRLKEISGKTFHELNRDRVLHFRQVFWEKTIEKNGFPDKRVSEFEPFHFALLGVNGQKARVYGGYADGVFYIVWFDLEHKIWPTFLKHT